MKKSPSPSHPSSNFDLSSQFWDPWFSLNFEPPSPPKELAPPQISLMTPPPGLPPRQIVYLPSPPIILIPSVPFYPSPFPPPGLQTQKKEEAKGKLKATSKVFEPGVKRGKENFNSHNSLQNIKDKLSRFEITKKKKKESRYKYIKFTGHKKISDFDPRFYIDVQRISDGKDKRTTLMIKNIPNKYSQKMLLNELKIEFESKFDVLYLPIDFDTMANSGYAFINFIDSKDIEQFYNSFNDKKWPLFNSDKICRLTYASIQGKNNLVKHYEYSSINKLGVKKYQPWILDKTQ